MTSDRLVGFVKPTVSLTPAPAFKAPGILSRAEIARLREANERQKTLVGGPPPDSAIEVVGQAYYPAPVALVEMHEADVTPLPKNKGGRPRKEV